MVTAWKNCDQNRMNVATSDSNYEMDEGVDELVERSGLSRFLYIDKNILSRVLPSKSVLVVHQCCSFISFRLDMPYVYSLVNYVAWIRGINFRGRWYLCKGHMIRLSHAIVHPNFFAYNSFTIFAICREGFCMLIAHNKTNNHCIAFDSHTV